MPPKLVIEVVGDTAGLERSFKRATKQTQQFGKSINQAGRGALTASVGFRGLGRSVAFASSAFLGGAGLIAGIKSSVSAASNLAEQQSKTTVVFGESAGSVKAWSKTTVNAMGLAQDQALETASSFGALLRPLGLTGTEAAKQSKRLTQLGADLASFYNTSVADALQAIRSGLVGESEPLRRYGVLLTEARVAAEGMAQTGKKTAKELTAQEKVLARQAIILKDAAQAQGDFARTSGGLANQQRILSANVRNLQIAIGNVLIPEVLKIVRGLNDWFEKTENQRRVTDAIRESVAALKGVVAAVVPITGAAADAAKAFSDAVGGAKNAIKLLAAVIATVKFTELVAGLRASRVEAGLAAANMEKMRTRALLLSRLGPIAIAFTLVPTHQEGIAETQLGAHGSPNAFGSPADRRFQQQRRRRLAKGAIEAPRNPFLGISTFGLQGSGTAGRRPLPKPTTRGLDSFLPRSVQLALASARSEVDQRAALGQELAAVNKALRRRLTFDDRLALQQEKTSILSALESMNRAEVKARETGAKRVADAAKKAREKALKDAVASIRTGQLGVKGGLTLAQVNAAVSANQQAAQFRALGLTATGDQRAPTARGLLRLSDRLIGRAEPGKLENRVKAIRKVLVANFKGMSDEVRRTVKGMLDDIDQQLRDRQKTAPVGFKQGSPNKLASLLLPGGSAAERRALAARLSQIGPGGTVRTGRSAAFAGAGATGGIVIHGDIVVHGVQNVRELEDNLARRASQRARVRRGAS